MDTLRNYLNSLPPPEQAKYAARCSTTVGYLRKALSKGQCIGERLCIALDRESSGAVPCEELRPDADWDYLRRKYAPPGTQATPPLNGTGVAHV